MSLTLMYITNIPQIALIAEEYGVNRIWIDLEKLGKEERQKGMNTVKSQHTVDDIRIIKPLLKKAEMLVRIDPWNENSIQEIEDVIDAGADLIMLPMWKNATEVMNFIDAVNGRCKTILLLETKEAENCLDEVLVNEGVDEIHIGLNDLHLSYGKSFMFELLANGTVERIVKKIQSAGIPYGFGGIAKLGTGVIPAEKVIMEHYRLGSKRAILSRSFCNTDNFTSIDEIRNVFCENMNTLREYEKKVAEMSVDDFKKNQLEVNHIIEKMIQGRK